MFFFLNLNKFLFHDDLNLHAFNLFTFLHSAPLENEAESQLVTHPFSNR